MPTASERIIWGFGDGSTLPVLDTQVGRIGALICWENRMPLLRTAMYAKGELLFVSFPAVYCQLGIDTHMESSLSGIKRFLKYCMGII